MNLRFLTYLLVAIALLTGCGGRIGMRQLERLEARVNDAPDSVLTVLASSEPPRWGEARALYALLTVQAQDKSYIDVVDDSLIRVATEYYDHRGTPLRRLQAFYYHGRVYANAGHRHEAMTAYTRAKDFVPQVDASYPVGLLYAQLAVLYGYDYDYPQAVICMEEAMRYYELAGKEHLLNYAKLDLGQLYLSMENTKQAEPLFNEVLVWGEAHEDTYIIYSTLNWLLRLYDATEDTDALEVLLAKYPIETVLQNATTYGIIAHHYARKGEAALAETALDYAWDMAVTAQDAAVVLHKSYQVNKMLGHTDAALKNHERLFAMQDSTVRITLQQPLIASQRDHYQTQLELTSSRLLNNRYLIGISAIVLLIVAVLLYIYIRKYLYDKDRQLMQQIELANELRLTIYSKGKELDEIAEELQTQRNRYDSKLDAMNRQISELFRARYKLLDELSKTYYENNAAKTDKEHIYEKVMTEINRLSMDEEFKKLEKIINEYCDNVMARIRTELPKAFSKIDCQLLCCFYIGFSGKTISVFTGIEVNKIYVYKQRLRNKIYKSNAPSKQIMLDMMA